MFKRFTKEDINRENIVKAKVAKALRSRAMESMPGLERIVDTIWPAKAPVTAVKCENYVELIVIGNEILFFGDRDGPLMPTLRLLLQYPFLLPHIQVDRGAIKHVLGGAHIMCPGLTSSGARMDVDLPVDTVVAVDGEGKEHSMAIAKLRLSTADIRSINKDVGAEVIHVINDGLWQDVICVANDCMSLKWLGLVLSITGNCLIAAGLNLQKHAHVQNMRLPESQRKPYWMYTTWRLGVLGTVFGEGGNVTSFAFAPAALVGEWCDRISTQTAPLGAVSIVANAIISAFRGEKIRRRDILGTILCIVGGGVIAFSAPSNDDPATMDQLLSYMTERMFLSYLGIVISGSVFFVWLGKKHGRKHVAIYLSACALIGSITVMSIKGVSTSMRLTAMGQNQFDRPLPWILLIVAGLTGILQVHYLNITMAYHGNAATVPVFYVLFTTAVVVAGIILYKEFLGLGFWRVFSFLVGCLVTFSGVYSIAGGRQEAEHVSVIERLDADGTWEAGDDEDELRSL